MSPSLWALLLKLRPRFWGAVHNSGLSPLSLPRKVTWSCNSQRGKKGLELSVQSASQIPTVSSLRKNQKATQSLHMVFIWRTELIQRRSAFSKLIRAPPLGENPKNHLFCSQLRSWWFFGFVFFFFLFLYSSRWLALKMILAKGIPDLGGDSWMWSFMRHLSKLRHCVQGHSNNKTPGQFISLLCRPGWQTTGLKDPNRQLSSSTQIRTTPPGTYLLQDLKMEPYPGAKTIVTGPSWFPPFQKMERM